MSKRRARNDTFRSIVEPPYPRTPRTPPYPVPPSWIAPISLGFLSAWTMFAEAPALPVAGAT
jgi:hypothetical protein